jgi:poly(3-hydroxybutyrate) depolymerase
MTVILLDHRPYSRLHEVSIFLGGMIESHIVVLPAAVILQCFSYKPVSYNARSSPLLVVLHGAQRNAADYRDWSKALADKTGALVVAPHFPAEQYVNEAIPANSSPRPSPPRVHS